jgi:DnaJ-class molecular chaperone
VSTWQEEATRRFKEVAEAYDVLSDKEKRAVYDRYGEQGLSGGVGGEDESAGSSSSSFRFRPYNFRGDPMEMFSQFFGTSNPFSAFMGEADSTPFGAMGGHFASSRFPAQEQSVTFDLGCTLEELYRGTTKRLKITRQRWNAAENRLVPDEKVLEVPVRPGFKPGTKITFEREGD